MRRDRRSFPPPPDAIRQLLIEPCSADDARYDAWLKATANALSPRQKIQQRGIRTLTRLGFRVRWQPPPDATPPTTGGAWAALTSLTQAACLLLAVSRTAFRPGAGGPICGKTTRTGHPCQNPTGCRIKHTGPPLPAPMVAVVEASNQNLPGGNLSGAKRATNTLKKKKLLAVPEATSTYATPDPAQIAAVLSLNQDGFTVSPRNVTDPGSAPVSGVCVGLDNTAMKWQPERGAAFAPNGKPTPLLIELMADWVETCDQV